MTTLRSLASAGRRPERLVANDRRPSGGYRTDDTAAAASAAVSISGTITPHAPASSARPMGVMSLAATRTRPTDPPAASIACNEPSSPA
jgi:hypothetical protein